jgi:replicative DNA helicase
MKKESPNIRNDLQPYGIVPPQAIEAEEAVLGALIVERDAYSSVASIISYKSFYKDEHKIIFNRIRELSDKGTPIDLMVVVQSLRDNDELDKVGGPMAITELSIKVSAAANIESWAKIIQQKFIQRELIRIGLEIQSKAYDDTLDVVESVEFASDQISELFVAPGSNLKLASDLVEEMHERIRKNYESENDITGISTGIPKLDKHTGGFQETDFTVLAAESGQGKTSLAITT